MLKDAIEKKSIIKIIKKKNKKRNNNEKLKTKSDK
jgi:hypothetical protein